MTDRENIANVLQALQGEANAPSMYELSSYEAEAAYELENFIVREGLLANRNEANRVARVISQKPNIRAAMLTASRGAGGGNPRVAPQGLESLGGGNPGNPYPMSAAQFDITVRRLTATIAQPLPVVLFSAQDAQSGFPNLLPQQLPAGVTVTGVRFGVNGIGAAPFATTGDRLVIQYTDAALNTDAIEITSSNLAYPSLLQSAAVDLLRISKIRYIISDAAQQTQYAQAMGLVMKNMFGVQKTNPLSPASFLDPRQFQAGVRDIDGTFNIDKETGILTNIIAVPNFQFTLSMFVEKLYAQTAKGW